MHGGVPINAKKGHMIIFPSSVRHASEFNNTPYSRHSLAMNFMPSSQVFQFDSSYHYGSDSFNVSKMGSKLDKGFG